VTLRTAIEQGARLLEHDGIAAPRLTAEVLLCHALGRERPYLYSHSEDELSELAWIHYGRYLWERSRGKPTQYITKKQEFYGREFRVSPSVLIPRPETEHVVERAIELAGSARDIVDVGCGSGAIAVTLALETNAEVWSTDLSGSALEVAAWNAQRLGAAVQFVRCDLMAALGGRTMDIIISNPPYIPTGETDAIQREVREYEPHLALFAGPSGLEIYQRIVNDAARVLRPGGWLVFELGYRAAEGVSAMLDERWERPTIGNDLAGLPRVLSARLLP
jgi:release factor glutamine methyltransferase